MSWNICFRGQTDAAKFGLELVRCAVKEYEQYEPAVSDSIPLGDEDDIIIIACRAGNNCQKREMDAIAGAKVPSDEGYLVKFGAHPYNWGRRMILITSETEQGLLYGCVDFVNKYLPKAAQAHQHNPVYYYFLNPFKDGFADATHISEPDITERGLWTWGHVIYDYKKYFEHMALCKLNTVTIWNDFTPLNAKAVYEYAHSLGIRVIWGLSVNWDEKEDITSEASIRKWAGIALEKCRGLYREHIADGIYVQTFTETREDNIGGALIAENVVRWTNAIYETIAAEIPGIDFRLGLHATSVINRLDVMAGIHPDVKIIWEDAGQFPYNYVPETDIPDFADAMENTRRIACLREGRNTGATLKGLCCLDWLKFRHMSGPVNIGCADREQIDERMAEKIRIWRYVQSFWLVNSEACREVIAEYKRATDGNCHLCALVEDGLFDAKLWYPVALCAEIMWSCNADIAELVRDTAQRPCVAFA